ncbi:hypothetical protein OOK41_08875 [Micromonospora sp. NBC_01655]|uniref:hypothetical protein n=1 Tax=unclassified Micromonospora TaxID=2617518 RepID=UPI000FFF302C|nr:MULTISPECIES: hypothetical protein [unclassified Micromonospora]MCX4470417.1 hypothetical protein [Micromonospora sp. NBC_01655]
MTIQPPADPIEALERFLARIAPYDDPAAEPVATVDLRVGRLRGSFRLTDRSARALSEALGRWTDPDDVGRCGGCGGPVDRDLVCRSCGRLDGIFGATVAHHAERVAGHPD